MKSINPFTGQEIATYELMHDEQVNHVLANVAKAQVGWSRSDVNERTKLLLRLEQELQKRKEEFALLITQEMGKVFKEAISEIEKCAWVCRYYADHAASMLADSSVNMDNGNAYVTYQPSGVVLAIMPWNFPFWQVFRAAVPVLVAGNGVLLKHAANVCGCSLAISRLFHTVGIDALDAVIIEHHQIESMIAQDSITGVTLTGSVKAGKTVASLAGKHLKKSVLELGGSDPYLIFADADMEHAAGCCMQSRMVNAGQSCIGAKRVIVQESVVDEFTNICLALMHDVRCGDPTDQYVTIGSMVSKNARDALHQQVLTSVEQGAILLCGGKLPEDDSACYPATLLANVTPGMPAFDEELFGPVLSIIAAKDQDEMIRFANHSSYGLGGAVFSSDVVRATHIAKTQLHVGSCAINDFVRSDPRLPFGGVKHSGYGRELAKAGLLEFCNIKSVVEC